LPGENRAPVRTQTRILFDEVAEAFRDSLVELVGPLIQVSANTTVQMPAPQI
jgi:hypothetical protein